MKYIAAAAVIGVILLQLAGAIPRSSVDGPMVIATAFLVAALAVGIYDAWTKKLGVLGWIVNIVASVVGALLGASLGGLVLEIILSFAALGEPLATSGNPLMYFALAATMLVTLAGSWGALWIVNRLR